MVTTRNNPIPQTAGFTLLELLVVLAIAGMLVALVPAAVSAVVPGTKARTAAYDMASILRDARNLAISQSTPVDVVFDLDGQGTQKLLLGNLDSYVSSPTNANTNNVGCTGFSHV